MVAVLAGVATLIGLNMALALLYGFACGTSQFLNMMLRFSWLSLPIKLAAWFGTAWVALSVFQSLQ